jgi:TonB family protein
VRESAIAPLTLPTSAVRICAPIRNDPAFERTRRSPVWGRGHGPKGHVLPKDAAAGGASLPSTSVTCPGYSACLGWKRMPLRCLLFSSNEEMVQPIWQVLTDLEIEGEYCKSAVDAVERVTTQLFQIVIMDWEDQPEAGFLVKTARDLKAAHRPLILAIVGDEAGLPEALEAGANSVLVKPIHVEQVRGTMSTACELLRSKFQPPPKKTASVVVEEKPQMAAMAAAASSGGISIPLSVARGPEKTFLEDEFLTLENSAPGAPFDVEPHYAIPESLDYAEAAEVGALIEPDPMASAVEAVEEAAPQPAESQAALTGWASLQARLTKSTPQPVEDAPAKSELLSFVETPSYGAPAATPYAKDIDIDKDKDEDPARQTWSAKSGSAAAASADGSEETQERVQSAERPGAKRGKVVWVGAFAVACVVLATVPRARQNLEILCSSAAQGVKSWLNPPPAPLPQPVPLHDNFGQDDDRYKFPAAGSIPSVTAGTSRVRVLPATDPAAKTEKGPEAKGGQAEDVTAESNPADQSQSGQAQEGNDPMKDSAQANLGAAPGASGVSPVIPAAATPPPVTPTEQSVAPPVVSAGSGTGIPSSLKSQMASSTPDASGNKSAEAAMAAIEPVNLPESAARGLLAQPVDPQYPAAAKASGQRGTVVLQVLIGRDGAVQDAKFLEGSLVFARAAIDAVKQWRFRPYSMNGRAVSVESMITLNFTPPA